MSEESLFHLALEKPPGERADFLEQACGGDAALRRRIEALLAAHDNPGSFLRHPPVPSGATAAPGDRPTTPGGEGPGSRLGPYKLLQQLGEGGMGTVFLAEQTQPVRRAVALKVIRPGLDSRQVLARFEAERQALALMDHPNIARVLDAGTTDSGRPFFVMELVKGVPLTKFCDDRHLTPRERLGLFVPVCQAVQHAHQKGIIHRDLKPSNVLVALYDDKPTPKVIDFGVAKAMGPKLTERTLFTEFGAVVGTLEYMSPEQAQLNQLDIDTRSDVYSLGVLLYELLTGTTPLERKGCGEASFLEILRRIREEEPPRPSLRLSATAELPVIAANRGLEPKRLSGLVRGELDWIVMKALEKDRNRRYETANGLARDIERYLRDEPVQACPPSAGYRLRKLIRRRWRGLLLTALVCGLLLVTAGGLGWAAWDRDVRQAGLERQADEALDSAEAAYADGQLTQADAAVKRAEGLLAAGEAKAELRGRARQWRVDLDMVARLEEIRHGTATPAKRNALNTRSADPAYRRAFQEFDLDVETLEPAEAARRVQTSAVAARLLAALDDWLLAKMTTHGSAGREALLEVLQQADPDPWRSGIRAAFGRRDVAALRDLSRDERLLAQAPPTVLLLEEMWINLGEVALAQDVLARAQHRHPQDFWINFDLGNILTLRLNPARPQEAVGYFQAAAAARPDNPAIHLNLATALLTVGRLRDAEAEYREALRIWPTYGAAHFWLGNALVKQGKDAQAEKAYREAARLGYNRAGAHVKLYEMFLRLDRPAEADKEYREAERLLPRSPEAAHELGKLLEKGKKWSEAIALYKEATRLQPRSAALHGRLAWLLTTCPDLNLRDAPRALEAAEKAVALAPQGDHGWQMLGWARYRAGNWKGSIEALEKSNALQKRPPGGDSFQWFFLAMSHARLGHKEEARTWYDRARAWMEKNGPQDEDLRRFRAEAAEVLGLEEKRN
jgi:serine/threonine protein kinase/tetratricopeptide (TPR) repeat protein